MNKLICLSGMCGSGKSEVAEYIQNKRKHGFVRFGQVVLDEVKKLSPDKPNEALEKKVREEFRAKYGMAAFAILNIPKFDELLKVGDVIGDNLMSWEEYLTIKEKYGDNFHLIAVYAPPAIRYARLDDRGKKHGDDKKWRFRSFTKEEAVSRDRAEIENLHKAGPIAMADHTIINDGTIESLHCQIDKILEEIYA